MGSYLQYINGKSCSANPQICDNIKKVLAADGTYVRYVTIKDDKIAVNLSAILNQLRLGNMSIGSQTPALRATLRDFGNYEELEKPGTVYDPAAPAPAARLELTNIGKLVKNRLLAASSATPVDIPSIPDEEGQYKNFAVPQNKFNRDTNGELYMEDENGNKTKVNDGAEMERMLNQQCFGTGLKGGPEKCNQFMFECLLSDPKNLDKCITDLTGDGNGFYAAAVEDIKHLHPIVALRILQQFGFHKYKTQDSRAGYPIYKVESVGSWVKNYLAQHYGTSELQTLLRGDHSRPLLDYLSLMTQFVNANPAILNKGYSGKTKEAVGEVNMTEYAARLGLKIEQVDRSTRLDELNRLRHHLQWARPNVRTMVTQNPFGFGAFTPGVPLVHTRTPVGGLFGGGNKCQSVYKMKSSGQV